MKKFVIIVWLVFIVVQTIKAHEEPLESEQQVLHRLIESSAIPRQPIEELSPRKFLSSLFKSISTSEVSHQRTNRANSFITPRNLSASPLYKGIWSSMNSSTAAESKGNKMFLKKTRGDFFFGNIHANSETSIADSIEAQFVLRDGTFATDPAHGYVVKGAYIWPIGLLLLEARAEGVFLNSTALIFNPEKMLNTDDLSKAFLQPQPDLTPSEIEQQRKAGKCSLKIALRAGATRNAKTGNEDTSTIVMTGQIMSPDCGFVLHADAQVNSLQQSYRSALYYIVFVYMLSLSEMLLMARQMDSTNTPASASRVSSLLIGLQAMLDSYYSLLHLVVAVLFTQTLFYAFGIASFIYFVKFSMFDMRYLMYVWRAQNPTLFNQNVDQIRRKLSILYIEFYGLLIVGFLTVYYIPFTIYVFLFGLNSYWIPQIFSNALHGTTASLTPHFIIGTSITRSLIPLYFLAWSGNFVHIEPSYSFSFIVMTYIAIQCVFLFLQEFKGPRFFVPKWALPAKYDYHRQVPESVISRSQTGRLECVICMSHVDVNLVDNQQRIGNERQLEEGIAAQRRQYMLTPCNHIFHQDCLSQWLEFKLECPTCRAVLPVP